MNKEEAQQQPEVQQTENQAQEIENPTALLNAYERVKEDKKKLAREKEELEKRYQNIDLEKYNELIEQQKKLEQDKIKAEEEKLIQEQNWEVLLDKKTRQIEEQYGIKLEKANSDLSEVTKSYQSTNEALAIAQNQIDELRRKFAAYDTFIQNKGKPESFKYVWDADLKAQTRLNDAGQLELLKAPGAEEVLFDDEGNIVTVTSWMEKFRTNGGANFFNPITQAAGSGATPSPNVPPQVAAGKVLTISRSQLGDLKTMKAIAQQLDDGNINKAIMDGRVVVK